MDDVNNIQLFIIDLNLIINYSLISNLFQLPIAYTELNSGNLVPSSAFVIECAFVNITRVKEKVNNVHLIY